MHSKSTQIKSKKEKNIEKAEEKAKPKEHSRWQPI
jgi:hypothetical protein